MDGVQDGLDISTTAARMGITSEAVRKRISRGTLAATKQDGRWHVVLDGILDASRPSRAGRPVQDTGQDVQDNRPDDKDHLIQVLSEELEARRREVQELHVLLQTAQTALMAPKARPWWRWW